MPAVVITIEGTASVRRRLHKVTNVLQEPHLAIIAEYTKNMAQFLAPKDTGMGANNIEAHVYDMMAEVISPDTHMVVMEFGRMPNRRMPSTKVLEGWGQRHGFVGRKALFALAISIGTKGVRGKRFMTKAAEAARAKLSNYTDELVVKVKKEWDSGD